MWTYNNANGQLSREGKLIEVGYSGRGLGLNNPAMIGSEDVGPIPYGSWTIGPAYTDSTKGPFVMSLIPDSGTRMFGRFGFKIHGDRKGHVGEHIASDGCIILGHATREQIAVSGDTTLEVV